jgi:hypothetical protein
MNDIKNSFASVEPTYTPDSSGLYGTYVTFESCNESTSDSVNIQIHVRYFYGILTPPHLFDTQR